jgi:hypothetical protein
LGRVIGCTQWRSTGLVLLVLHALALHALAMAPAQAGAQTEDGEIERWRERHEAASAALRADDFARAEALEREALAIRPAPQSAFNLGLALRGQRRMREAADTFDRMLRGEWGPLPRARTEQATLLRDETRRALGRLRVSARASAPVLVQVDGVRAGEIRAADPPLEAAIDPGAHVVIASASRHTAIERTVEVASGATVSLDLVLTPESDGEIPREGVGRRGHVVGRRRRLGRGRRRCGDHRGLPSPDRGPGRGSRGAPSDRDDALVRPSHSEAWVGACFPR